MDRQHDMPENLPADLCLGVVIAGINSLVVIGLFIAFAGEAGDAVPSSVIAVQRSGPSGEALRPRRGDCVPWAVLKDTRLNARHCHLFPTWAATRAK